MFCKKLTNIAATDGDSFGAAAAVSASFGCEFFYVFSFLLLHSLVHSRAISKIFFSLCGPTKKKTNFKRTLNSFFEAFLHDTMLIIWIRYHN